MAAFLGNLRNVVIAGFVLAALVFLLVWQHASNAGTPLSGPVLEWFFLRWLHVACGVMWIGLLWYFNFVATPTMPKIPEDLRPALGKYITPAALFWFRWGAMGTIVLGIILAWRHGYLVDAYTLDALDSGGAFSNLSTLVIGIGMWLGTIMWFNVWFLIWPNQQRALNIGGKGEGLDAAAKAASAKTAGQFSRINTLLSIPMLFCMVGATHLFA
jgi:uncharacterized membrane protein